ncbi:DoxX-like family protein [Chitinophaga jiangningensis]|uniref:DoxX-like family protein n=1 Tax=Chitinophaga jiangningensis TaxID=1419482 RepID=A0A1M7M8R0_9BACT|nr:DoxX family protein [Chitinophaga jiangningensis]SHM87068.1 DoxX-like family protein [Chitinophaga jiangningensis]
MTTTPKVLNVLLWMAQGILAATLLWAGFMKILAPQGLPFPWVKEHPLLVVLTGITDLLGGAGVVLPGLLRILPKLVVTAAYGIIALMISAIIFHISRGEASDIGFNIGMIVIALFVAWGRRRYL